MLLRLTLYDLCNLEISLTLQKEHKKPIDTFVDCALMLERMFVSFPESQCCHEHCHIVESEQSFSEVVAQ
jgi:hypothetical protein